MQLGDQAVGGERSRHPFERGTGCAPGGVVHLSQPLLVDPRHRQRLGQTPSLLPQLVDLGRESILAVGRLDRGLSHRLGALR